MNPSGKGPVGVPPQPLARLGCTGSGPKTTRQSAKTVGSWEWQRCAATPFPPRHPGVVGASSPERTEAPGGPPCSACAKPSHYE